MTRFAFNLHPTYTSLLLSLLAGLYNMDLSPRCTTPLICRIIFLVALLLLLCLYTYKLYGQALVSYICKTLSYPVTRTSLSLLFQAGVYRCQQRYSASLVSFYPLPSLNVKGTLPPQVINVQVGLFFIVVFSRSCSSFYLCTKLL